VRDTTAARDLTAARGTAVERGAAVVEFALLGTLVAAVTFGLAMIAGDRLVRPLHVLVDLLTSVGGGS